MVIKFILIISLQREKNLRSLFRQNWPSDC